MTPSDDTPLRLEEAARLAFRPGAMTAAILRKEAYAGASSRTCKAR
jgi:hypothetical protein